MGEGPPHEWRELLDLLPSPGLHLSMQSDLSARAKLVAPPQKGGERLRRSVLNDTASRECIARCRQGTHPAISATIRPVVT